MDLRDTILALCGPQGPSGAERRAMETAEELLRPLVDEIRTDPLGNRIGIRRCGKKNAPLVMLDAHMDQVGLIVTGYEKGCLHFRNLGGIDVRLLPSAAVTILAPGGDIPGVICVPGSTDRKKPVPMDQLVIDAGWATDEEAKAAVPPGTPVAYASEAAALGKDQLCSRSLDDRSCAAILLAVMEETKDLPLDVDLAVHLAVQEEVGGRGAVTGAYGIRPDYALVVDVTFGRSPGSPREKTLAMNGGAAIGVGPVMARGVSDRLEQLANENGIPFQIEVMGGRSGTDADEIQISRGGVATGVISLPLKYMHSPVEVIDLRDARAIVDLIRAWLAGPDREV